ncbi:NUDIX domain-containing protein [Streptomyces sp. NPDC060064]|uniref:NUDIX domain-containing protein n=1 Tax=Streptomyces sp. NPDC060064 TaxID=3347049 RepID=UPI00369D1AFE
MIRNAFDQRVLQAAQTDARLARAEFDDASQWLAAAGHGPMEPLAAEVWVFDQGLARVLLVKHRWRGWVPPGGKVEPGETPREGARRELFEETGIEPELLPEPAAVAVRSYHPDWPVTLGLSYVAVADTTSPLIVENGQPATWMSLADGWESCFPDDPSRMRQHARWLARETPGH